MGEDYFTHRQSVKLQGDCCPGCAGEYLDFTNASAEGEITALRDQGGFASVVWVSLGLRGGFIQSVFMYRWGVLGVCLRGGGAAAAAPPR